MNTALLIHVGLVIVQAGLLIATMRYHRRIERMRVPPLMKCVSCRERPADIGVLCLPCADGAAHRR